MASTTNTYKVINALIDKLEDDLSLEEYEALEERLEKLPSTLGADDWVVESGTTGIWTWEKWKSGKAVC